MNAKLASLFLKLYVHFDKKSGGTPLFIHHARICSKCHFPIRRNHKHATNPYRHLDCKFPDGVYPSPEALATHVNKEFPQDAA